MKTNPLLIKTGAILLLTVMGLNALVYRQAQALLRFQPTGRRTQAPDKLSRWQKLPLLWRGVTLPKPQNEITPSLPYETHHYPVEAKIELEAWYLPHPTSRGLILMFHGYAAAKSSLLPEAYLLHELGYALFMVDFRGSGGSNQAETSIGYHEAADVMASVRYVQATFGESQPILYGQSMGAAALFRAVAVHGLQPHLLIVEALFDRLLTTVSHRVRAMGLPAYPLSPLLLFWGSLMQGHSAFAHNPRDYAPKISCPVLMMHGSADKRATLSEALSVFERLPGPKQFHSFEGLGHVSYAQAQPDPWRERLHNFLAD